MALGFARTGFASCCGLEIIHALFPTNLASPLLSGLASVAVTNGAQRTDGTTTELRKMGFEEVGSFTGNSNNRLVLWLRQRPLPQPAARWISLRTGRPVTTTWAVRNQTKVVRG